MTCRRCGGSVAPERVFCSRRCAALWASPPKGVWVGADGRAWVSLRRGKQLYSRCLMEGHLGRHLAYEEVVHHVNGDPTDDRLENLVVISRKEHAAIHRDVLRRPRKLTDDQMQEILESSDTGRALAARFGVSPASICLYRKAAGVPAPPPPLKTVCVNGHPLDAANTRVYGTRRECRACDRDRKRHARELNALRDEMRALAGAGRQ